LYVPAVAGTATAIGVSVPLAATLEAPTYTGDPPTICAICTRKLVVFAPTKYVTVRVDGATPLAGIAIAAPAGAMGVAGGAPAAFSINQLVPSLTIWQLPPLAIGAVVMTAVVAGATSVVAGAFTVSTYNDWFLIDSGAPTRVLTAGSVNVRAAVAALPNTYTELADVT
jgi:hypothetical protein